MKEKFYMGIMLGMVAGALIVANSVKARKAVVDGQTEVVEKVDEMAKKVKKSVSPKSQKAN